MSGFDDTNGIIYRYHEIHLNEVDWHGIDPILLVLAPFLRGVTRANAKQVAQQMYEQSPPEYRTLLLGALFNLMARSFKDISEIEQAILEQVRVTMDELIDAVENGPMAARIMERAEARGENKGKSKSLAVTWKVRFGTVPQDVSAALAAADAAHLDALLDAFAEDKPEADLCAALGL